MLCFISMVKNTILLFKYLMQIYIYYLTLTLLLKLGVTVCVCLGKKKIGAMRVFI